MQAENEIMALRMKYVDDHNTLLRTEKRSLEQKLSACMGEKNIKEGDLPDHISLSLFLEFK